MRVIGVLLMAALVAAGAEKKARRLEAVTWSPGDHKLTWTVSEGKVERGAFKESKKLTYVIDMDAATMNLDEEGRRFSGEEAVRVHALMDLVAKYAAESTVWWEAGEGQPIGKDDKPRLQNPHEKRESPRPGGRPPRDSPVEIQKISITRSQK